MTRPVYEPVRRRTNGKAVAALVCGVVSLITCLLFIGIPAVVLANLATREIDGSNGSQDGRALAVVGRILGWISTTLLIVVLIVVLILLIAVAAR